MIDRAVWLPELEKLVDRELILKRVDVVRRRFADPRQYEVRATFAESLKKIHVLWVALERAWLLVLESRWLGGRIAALPFGVRGFTLRPNGVPMWIHAPIGKDRSRANSYRSDTAQNQETDLWLQLRTARDETVYLPLWELLRAHYLSIPRAIPSLMGGLLSLGTLAGSDLQAWGEGTGWRDKDKGVAAFRRAAFISVYEAASLARLMFSVQGYSNLRRLRKWVEREFTQQDVGKRREHVADLPKLTLPYDIGRWTAATQRLANDAAGRSCYLVSQVLSFDAEEPYASLVLDGEELSEFGKRCESDPATSDGTPVSTPTTPISEAVLPVDWASRRRAGAGPS